MPTTTNVELLPEGSGLPLPAPELPASVLSHIFGFLGVDDLRLCCLVCQEWRDQGLSEPLWCALAKHMWPQHTLINASYGGSFRRLVLNRNARNAVPGLDLLHHRPAQPQPHPHPQPQPQPQSQQLPQPQPHPATQSLPAVLLPSWQAPPHPLHPQPEQPEPEQPPSLNVSSYWRLNSPLRYYRCRLLHLEMQPVTSPVGPAYLRLYFDARGERDLRTPAQSSLAVVRFRSPPRPPAAAGAAVQHPHATSQQQQQPQASHAVAAAAATAAASGSGGAAVGNPAASFLLPILPGHAGAAGAANENHGGMDVGEGGFYGQPGSSGDYDDAAAAAADDDDEMDEAEEARGGPDLRSLELHGLAALPNPLALLWRLAGQPALSRLQQGLQRQGQGQVGLGQQGQVGQQAAGPSSAGPSGNAGRAPQPQPQTSGEGGGGGGGGGGAAGWPGWPAWPCSLHVGREPSSQLGVVAGGQRASACWLAEGQAGHYKGCLEWSGPPLARLLRALDADPHCGLVFVYASVLNDLGYTSRAGPDYSPALLIGPRQRGGGGAGGGGPGGGHGGWAPAAAPAAAAAGGGAGRAPGSFAAEWRRMATCHHAPGELLERLSAESEAQQRARWADLPEGVQRRGAGWWVPPAPARQAAAAGAAAAAAARDEPRFTWVELEEPVGLWG